MARFALAASCLVLLAVGSASADGGSGTYTSAASTYYFNLFNGGATAWQYFVVVGTPETRFVGGGTSNEGSARCVPEQPDGLANEMECGPMSATVLPPNGHLGFVAILSAAPPCGAPFQLYASSTGSLPFDRVGDAIFAGSCTAGQPRATTPPSLHGVPAVGRTLTATAPTWSVQPTRVSFQWQLCSAQGCVRIKGATRLTLRLTARMARHSVRITSVATFDGRTVESFSRRITVRT
jgi:hypothetical protein